MGFVVRQAEQQAARRAVDVGRLRLRGDGRGHRRDHQRRRALAPGPRGRQGPAAGRPVARCRRPRIRRRPSRSAGTSTRRAPRPIPRAPSTPTARSSPSAVGMSERLGRSPSTTATRWCSRSPTSAASAGSSARRCRVPDRLHRARSTRPTTIALIQQHGVTMAGAGTPFHMAYLAAQRQLPAGERLFPDRAHLLRRRGAEAAAAPLRHQGGDGRRLGIVSGYGPHRGADPRDGQSLDDTDEQLATHRGPAQPAPSSCALVTLEGKEAGIGEEGEIRAKAPQLMKGYLDCVARRRRLRRGRLVQDRRPRPGRRRRHGHDHRPGEGHHHPQHGEHLGQGGRGPPLHPPRPSPTSP